MLVDAGLYFVLVHDRHKVSAKRVHFAPIDRGAKAELWAEIPRLCRTESEFR